MTTFWGENLDKENVLPEYPRPQLVRQSYLNLNGYWEYGINKVKDEPLNYDGKILVPFSPESPLSGVMKSVRPDDFLWYKREFILPDNFNIGRVILHFGACDQNASVWVNDNYAGSHSGGFTPFSFDITEFLSDVNKICVRVTDGTDSGYEIRGLQSLKDSKRGRFFQSGIWQTVWCESVPQNYIKDVFVSPAPDENCVYLLVDGEGECEAALDGEEFSFDAGQTVRLDLEDPHLWSPEDPFLYELCLRLGEDSVQSYFAMRKFSVEEDREGVTRFFLNGKPYFINGVLDPGIWPDGLYTPPCDDALLYDIETAKNMGFNAIRREEKIDCARFYYHCDRTGMLVLQDMPSGGEKISSLVERSPLFTGVHFKDSSHKRFGRKNSAGRESFEEELTEAALCLHNCACVAVWTVFNEGRGQFDSTRLMQKMKELDPSRIIIPVGGWHDQGFGEVRSFHIYYDQFDYKEDKNRRAQIISEFGGYSCPIEGHNECEKIFAYKQFDDPAALRAALLLLYDGEIRPAARLGLSGSVYNRLCDLDGELTGLMTYDRKVLKIEPNAVSRTVMVPNVKY